MINKRSKLAWTFLVAMRIASSLVFTSCSLWQTRESTILCILERAETSRECLLVLGGKERCSLQTKQGDILTITHLGPDELTIRLQPVPTSNQKGIEREFKKIPEEEFTSHEVNVRVGRGERLSCGAATRKLIQTPAE